MRRLHGALLASALLLVAGCGSGEGPDDAAAGEGATVIRTPTLAATSEAITAAQADDELTATVLVTSPDGVSSPGLDAAVSVLLERAGFEVVVVAPSGGTAPGGPAETMSGFPAHVVDGSVDDVIPVALQQLGMQPDLVVVGIVDGSVVGSAIAEAQATRALAAASRHDLPSIAVAAGDHHGVDLAAAGVMLRSVLDLRLEDLLAPGRRVLAVPSCGGGLVRDLLDVDVAMDAPAPPVVDCVRTEPGEPTDDVDAHARGYATLVELGQAIP